MSVTESVIRLESWKPILEWDENISGVPSYLEKDRQVILNARNEKYQTVEVTPEIIDKIRRLIEDDVAPGNAFARAGISYNYYRTEKLGLREVVDRYYERKSRIYEVDQMTQTIRSIIIRTSCTDVYKWKQVSQLIWLMKLLGYTN